MPRHPESSRVNQVLERAEEVLRQIVTGELDPALRPPCSHGELRTVDRVVGWEDQIYANSYIDLGKAEVVGFDYDYTLVSYKPALLDLIYDMARRNLVDEMQYPANLTNDLQSYDHAFAIRGLAVDLKTAWICKLTSRYRVSTAYFGRERVTPEEVREEFKSAKGTGIMPPVERRQRLRPLNDLFSQVEACLLADVVQWFKQRGIQFDPRSVVTDVLAAVTKAHTCGDMHRTVVDDLDHFIEPDGKRHLRQLLEQIRAANKKTMLVSNSPFWYVDKGMRYLLGNDWRILFDAVIVSAGKPAFYTENRPFREVSTRTNHLKFKPVTAIHPDEVYSGGSITGLMELTGWGLDAEDGTVDGSKIVYMGDSLFADLVDARRLYGWTTVAIIRELQHELQIQSTLEWRRSWHTMQAIMYTITLCQEALGNEANSGNRQGNYSNADKNVLDALENLASDWRQKQEACLNKNFGSIFRSSKFNGKVAAPSLFQHFLARHVDFYTSRVENLRLYSTDHRFIPSDMHVGAMHEATHTTDPILGVLLRGSDADLPESPTAL